MKRIIGLGAMALALVGCGGSDSGNDDPGGGGGGGVTTVLFDYKAQGEHIISTVFSEGSTVVCEAPASTRISTTFMCTATKADGTTEKWKAEIIQTEKVTATKVTT